MKPLPNPAAWKDGAPHKKAARWCADGFLREGDDAPFQKSGCLSAAAEEGETTEDAQEGNGSRLWNGTDVCSGVSQFEIIVRIIDVGTEADRVDAGKCQAGDCGIRCSRDIHRATSSSYPEACRTSIGRVPRVKRITPVFIVVADMADTTAPA
jgi:hypothetical protein